VLRHVDPLPLATDELPLLFVHLISPWLVIRYPPLHASRSPALA
jgi:hypothetical protein